MMTPSRASRLPNDIRIEYPFSSNLLHLDSGAKMHYLDEGSGPVVLMLHGNPTWSFYYRNLINELVAKGFRCVVPDHIGCGLSDKPQDYSYTLQQRMNDVEALLDHLGVSKFSLVVHDWGGAIGLGVAGRRPEAVERQVILNTAAFRSLRIPARIAAIKVPAIGESIIRGLNGFAGPATIMSAKTPLSRKIRKGYLYPYQSWKDRVAVWNFVKDIPLHGKHRSYADLVAVEEGLQRLKSKPTLLMWGAKDFCFTMAFYKRFLEFFPEAETEVYKKHGHYILDDAGFEGWRRISAFFVK